MPDEEPRPRAAKRGVLCESCFYRMQYALKAIPDLLANMRLRMVPAGVANYEAERIHTGKDAAPPPLRIDALDASDALFAKLLLWVDDLCEQFELPEPSIRKWARFGEGQGLRPVSPKSAHDIANQLTSWFLVRLETIAASKVAVAFHDDICWGWEDSKGVYKLTGQYGVEPKPLRAADKRECPTCGRREVFVKWPDTFDPDIAIMCGRCKWVAEPEKYGHYAKLFAI